MKTSIRLPILIALLCIGLGTDLRAQGSVFTYQGRLSDTNGPLSTNVAITFRLYPVPASGVAVWEETHPSVAVTNGLFVAPLGQSVPVNATIFNGDARWLGISVNGGAELTPRTPITAAPYAIAAGYLTGASALSGTYSGAVTFNNPGNTFNGSGTGLTDLNASQLISGTVPEAALGNAWKIGGNAGTTAGTHFLGTTDNQPLEIKVNGLRALRLEDNGDGADAGTVRDGAPNVIGGSPKNFVGPGVVGATISGGGATNYNGNAWTNRVEGDFATIGGGLGNAIGTNSRYSAIGGGQGNNIAANSFYSALGGGYSNNIAPNSSGSIIAGGYQNEIGTNSGASAIGGGYNNNIAPNSSYSIIAGGYQNEIGTNSGASAIGGGDNNNIAANSYDSIIVGGSQNHISTDSLLSIIVGGYQNEIGTNSDFSIIAGGSQNGIGTNANYSTIGGGQGNNIGSNSGASTIGGGGGNNIAPNSYNSIIVGGSQNEIGTNSALSAIGGGYNNNIAPNSFYSIIAGGSQNEIGTHSYSSVIGGGAGNNIGTNSSSATIGGGFNSIGANSPYATIPGGDRNFASNHAFAAGTRAKANHTGAFVWADSQNADFPSTLANQFAVRAGGGVRFETAGAGVRVDGVAVLAGSVPASGLSGTYSNPLTFSNPANSFTGGGGGLTALNASQLTSGTVPVAALGNAWRIGGNAGTTPGTHFLGTTDNRPFEIKVNGLRALRLEDNGDGNDPGLLPDGAPNVIGGAPNNSVAPGVLGAAIGGGGATNYGGSAYTNRVEGDFATIGGGLGNKIWTAALGSTIAGGRGNGIEANSMYGAIGGGAGNNIADDSSYGAIGGGQGNNIEPVSSYGAIGGGYNNHIGAGSYGAIGGGKSNNIESNSSYGAIGGGASNNIARNAAYATIPGGDRNFATNRAFAAGTRAKANHRGAFVWADSTDADFASTGENQFLIRAGGGMGINVAQPLGKLHVGTSSNALPLSQAGHTIIIDNAAENGRAAFLALAGPGDSNAVNRVEMQVEASENQRIGIVGTASDHEVQFRQNSVTRMRLHPNGNVGINLLTPLEQLHVNGNILATGAIIPNSDRRAKTDLKPVNPAAVLERVAKLPIHQWRFKTEPDQVKHFGPMAQDFHAAFGLGSHETAIATVDADGVALAAIQGLNQKVEEQRSELKQKETEITDLKRELAELKNQMNSIRQQLNGSTR